MDAGLRSPVGAVDLSQKGDDVFGMFAGNFDISQHDFAEAVQTCHQGRGIALVGCIQVEYIAAGQGHGLANPWRCLTMSTGQIHYELAPQVVYFRCAQCNIARNQLGEYLLSGSMPLKQCPPNEDHDIVGDA